MLFLFFIWTVFGYVWMLYDTIVQPTSWSNFTSWIWLLQLIFFTIYLLEELSPKKWLKYILPRSLLDAYFVPVLFACEWSAAIAIVYMMIDHALVFSKSIDDHGPVLTWIGNFIVHYLTLLFLFIFLHVEERTTCTNIIMAHHEYDGYRKILVLTILTLLYSYCVFFPAATHYGVVGMSNGATLGSLVLLMVAGLAVILSWAQDYRP